MLYLGAGSVFAGNRSPIPSCRRFTRNNRTRSPGCARTGVFHSGRFSLPSMKSGKSGKPMTASMTAFARRETTTPWGGLSWELRAVNHRYLELSLKLPDELRAIEPAVRELLGKRLGRGKVDCHLRLAAREGADVVLDESMVARLVALAQKTQELASTAGGAVAPC